MTSFRLGMIGMWHTHARGLVWQIAAHPDEFTLVAGWDPEPAVVASRRVEWEGTVPGFRIVPSAAEVLSEALDGVVVEGRVYNNIASARMALTAGYPVLLEKPAGCDGDDFHSLTAAARERGLHLQMLYLFRYMSAVQELLRLARTGVFGEIYHFRARLPKDLREYDLFLRDFAWHPGGIYFEMAGHVIDLMAAILGAPESVTPFHGRHHPDACAFVDNALTVFGYERGWAVIEVPALEMHPHQRRIELYGTRGGAVIPHLGSGHLGNRPVQPLEVWTDSSGAWETTELPEATLQIRDLREFAAVVRGEKLPDFSLEHDLLVQELLLRSSTPTTDSGAQPSRVTSFAP